MICGHADILAGVFLPVVIDIAFNLAVAYAAYWVASQFAGKIKNKLPSLSTYPVQGAMKAISKSKTYGTDRVAGNIILLGELHPYVVEHESGGKGGGGGSVSEETRYKRSFLISVGEGPAQLLKIWKGKKEIPLEVALAWKGMAVGTADSITWFDGSNNSGVRALTGEDYGDYKHNAMAFFDEYDLGNAEAIPNFSFEISTVTGYRYTYISESGKIWGVPLRGLSTLALDSGGAARNVGGGIVGLPCRAHPFEAGDQICSSGTTNYDGYFTLTAGTTADELQFSASFSAETFDGTERVVKCIGSLAGGPGYMVQDSSGNLYYGHNLAGSDPYYYITKISPDGTLSPDYEWLNVSWSGGASRACQGIDISSDDRYLYFWIVIGGPTPWAYMEKFDLTTGDRVWESPGVSWPGWDMAIDDDGNAYGSHYPTAKFDAATGALSYLTGSLASFNVQVDESMGIVLAAGWGQAYDKNLFVTELGDAVITADMAVGGMNGANTWLIGTGMVTTYDGFIYVLSYTPDATLYKISYDGATLAVVDSASAPASAQGIYFDLWGNLVVVRQNWSPGVTDIFHYYDTDLNFITSVDNFNGAMFAMWGSPAGGSWMQGNAVHYPGLRTGVLDANPADIIYDILTNRRYGARISADYIDAVSFEACRQYWRDNNMLISITIDESRPWQDWVDYILSHVAGYRFKSGGKLHLGVLKNETPVAALTDDDLVQPNPDAEVPPPKVRITPRPDSDTFNSIVVGWANRDNKYDMDTAPAGDGVDHARSGTFRPKTVELLGIKNRTLAVWAAWRFLIDGLYRFNLYKFTVTYANQLLETGDVVTLSDNHGLSAEKVRIMQVSEDVHGRGLDITAMDDYAEHYPTISAATQQTLYEAPAAVTLADAGVHFREDVETGKLYLSMVPGNASANGWYIYRSYDDVSYQLAGRCGIAGVTGGDANSSGTTQGTLAAHGSMTWRPDESVIVDIGTVTDLASASDADFWADRSLARIGAEIIAFKTATEIGGGLWRISNLRRGLFGTEATAHSASEAFCTLKRNFTYQFEAADVGQTLYFKVVTYYGDRVQSLADVTGAAVAIGGYCQRPAAASLLRLTADQDDGGSGQYSGSSFTLYWNLGGKNSGWNYGGWDVSGGGVPWNNYIADDELQGVVLKFEQAGGTAIGQREIAVGESATITKATDLGGNNPAVVKAVPRRVYESRLANKLQVDDGS